MMDEIYYLLPIKMLLNVIYEYMDIMQNSDFFSKLEYNNFLLIIGFRMIIHIFHINYIHTKNINDVYYNCQKAYYYYLEYLEQMYNTNMCQDLNYIDAILFVYSKTLVKYDNPNYTDERKPDMVSNNNNHSNPIVHPEKYTITDNEKFIKKMDKITNLLNNIFWWENSSIQPINLPKSILLNLLQKHYTNDTNEIQDILEEQQKISLNHSEYIDFLHSLSDSHIMFR